MRADVVGFGSEFAELGSTLVVVCTLPRQVGRSRAFEVRVDRIGGNRMDRVVIFPSRICVLESFPLAEVLD